MSEINQIYPSSQAELRAWLEKNIQVTNYPLWVVIYKKSSGKQSLSYDQVLEEAICFGLIDTQTRSVDDQRYAIVLRPRKHGGNWTRANLKIASMMIEQGKMRPDGLKALPPKARRL